MNLAEKNLTASQRADRLLGRLKARAAELRYGKLTLDVTVHDGHITEIECVRQSERWRAE